MDILAIIGMIAAIALFIYMVSKGFNMVLASAITAAIVALTSRLPVYEFLMGTWVPAEGAAATGFMTLMAGFIKKYLALFILASMLGRLLSDGGATRRIALSITNALVEKAKDKNRQFICVLMVPVLYFLLTYVGISGFVLVFTVMPIGKEIFERYNVPWRLYAFGGCQSIVSCMMIGSLQQGNIFAADVCGTSITSGVAISLVAVVVWWIATIFVIKGMLNHDLKKGADFLTDGAEIKKSGVGSTALTDEQLPNLFISILPLVLLIALSSAFKVPVVISLFIAIVVAIVTLWKNLHKNLMNSLATGATSCFASVFTVAACYAMGACIKTIPVFTDIMASVSAMPGLLGGVLITAVSAFIMGSSSSPIVAFGPLGNECFLSAGLEAGVAHRMLNIWSFPAIGPHNAGIANAASVCKMKWSSVVGVYLIGTWIPGIAVAAVTTILVVLGVF